MNLLTEENIQLSIETMEKLKKKHEGSLNSAVNRPGSTKLEIANIQRKLMSVEIALQALRLVQKGE